VFLGGLGDLGGSILAVFLPASWRFNTCLVFLGGLGDLGGSIFV
jgi:hypothetical protein